jgi:hypothetical protein
MDCIAIISLIEISLVKPTVIKAQHCCRAKGCKRAMQRNVRTVVSLTQISLIERTELSHHD